MPALSQLATVAFAVESTFAQPPADWSATGQQVFTMTPDFSAVAQAVVPVTNYRQRAHAMHPHVLGLKNAGFNPGAMYLHGSPATAAAGANAVSFPLSTILKNALGGEHLGFADAFIGGSASAPEVDAIASWAVGDWLFAVDESTGVGQFYRVLAKPGDDVVTLDRDLHFTPEIGDLAHAVITVYPDAAALVDHTNANHTTLSWFMVGDDSGDLIEVCGTKVNATFTGFAQGESPTVAFEGLGVTFANETLSDPGFAGTPAGEAPLVVGTGRQTHVLFADYGSPLAQVSDFSVDLQNGIKHKYVPSPSGVEGVMGFVGEGWGESLVELSVLYSEDYAEEFRAHTQKHLLVQVGDTVKRAIGFYCPRLEYNVNPARGDQTDLTASNLSLRCLEDNPATIVSNKQVAPFQLLFVA